MTERPKRPGPVYDRVVRPVVEGDFEAFASLLGIPVHQAPEFLPGSFADRSWQTDLLVRTGPRHLLHMEYMRTPEADFAARMRTEPRHDPGTGRWTTESPPGGPGLGRDDACHHHPGPPYH